MSLPMTEISGVEVTRDPTQCSVKLGTPTARAAKAEYRGYELYLEP